ncbi:MAG: adenosylmethionine-8-amino-7-oxononanoate aminotransferase [Zetaproteobacteria bacterium]|nr:MAG: adenosylmethionine-8-amino-7-oxononanoate aminotransferase [Zetaproteobacteria bacterium]
MTRLLILLLGLLPAACGYHLAGHGKGALPEDVKKVSLHANGVPHYVVSVLQQRLASAGYKLTQVQQEAEAEIRLQQDHVKYQPSAFDRAGIAVQYTMSIRGHMTILVHDQETWDSGVVTQTGDVFVSGGPASIEASRNRLEKDLQRQWLQKVWSRFRSGF